MKLETAIVLIEAMRDVAKNDLSALDPWGGDWAEAWARCDALTVALEVLDAVKL